MTNLKWPKGIFFMSNATQLALFAFLMTGMLINATAQAATWYSKPSGECTDTINIAIPTEPDGICPGAPPTITFCDWRSAGTWEDIGETTMPTGSAPNKVVAPGDRFVINHKVYYDGSGDLEMNGRLDIVQSPRSAEIPDTTPVASDKLPEFFVPTGRTVFIAKTGTTGSFNLFNAKYTQFRYTNGCNDGTTPQSGNFSNLGGVVTVIGSRVETAQDWASSGGGIRLHQDSCLFTGQNYQNSTSTDALIRTCADLGRHGSGNFQPDGTMYFDAFDLLLGDGTGGNGGDFGLSSGTLINGTTGAAPAGINYIETIDGNIADDSNHVDGAGNTVPVQNWCSDSTNTVTANGALTFGTEVPTGVGNCRDVATRPFPCEFCQGTATALDVQASCSPGPTGTVTLTAISSGGFPDGLSQVADHTFAWTIDAGDLGTPNNDTTTAFPLVNKTFTVTVTDAVDNQATATVVAWVTSGGDPTCTPTAVTIGSVALEASSIDAILAGLGAENMDNTQLFELLYEWNSNAATELLASTNTDLPQDIDSNALMDAIRNYLDPDKDGQAALFKWVTVEERGTIGFYVERQRQDGGWRKMNRNMLPGMIAAPLGAEYMLLDLDAQPGTEYQYRLIEQEATGGTHIYGPFSVTMP